MITKTSRIPVEWATGRWAEVSESQLNKSTWPDGPWMAEPDFVGWVEASGRRCMMVRNELHGAWCGYVNADEWLVKFEQVERRMGSWSSLEMMQEAGLPESIIRAPRGGLTYAGNPFWMPGLWLGYDCAHADDYQPVMAANGYARALPAQYVTLSEARENTLKIAAALDAQPEARRTEVERLRAENALLKRSISLDSQLGNALRSTGIRAEDTRLAREVCVTYLRGVGTDRPAYALRAIEDWLMNGGGMNGEG